MIKLSTCLVLGGSTIWQCMQCCFQVTRLKGPFHSVLVQSQYGDIRSHICTRPFGHHIIHAHTTVKRHDVNIYKHPRPPRGQKSFDSCRVGNVCPHARSIIEQSSCLTYDVLLMLQSSLLIGSAQSRVRGTGPGLMRATGRLTKT